MSLDAHLLGHIMNLERPSDHSLLLDNAITYHIFWVSFPSAFDDILAQLILLSVGEVVAGISMPGAEGTLPQNKQEPKRQQALLLTQHQTAGKRSGRRPSSPKGAGRASIKPSHP
eukprot:4120164-Amphidinium_carterae.1